MFGMPKMGSVADRRRMAGECGAGPARRFKRSSSVLFLALCLAGSFDCAYGRDYEIRNVTVVDGTGKPPRPHMSVNIKDERIESIVPARTGATQATIIDGAGKFLIPGLWDMHVHLSDIDEVGIPILPTYGVTSVRDMGGDIERIKKWREKIASKQMIGPRIKFCGPMLEGSWEQKQGERTDHWAVATPEAARETVAKLAKAGVDCIKMRSYKSPESYFALADESKKAGVPLVGHAPWGVEALRASDAGQRSFEHGFYPWPWADLPDEQKHAIEDKFRINGTTLVPTLIAWQTFLLPEAVIDSVVHDVEGKSDPRLRQVSPALRKNWTSGEADVKKMVGGDQALPGWNKAMNAMYDQIRDMHERGVAVMAGTDTGTTLVYPGAALHQELKLLVAKCHFTPSDALLTATIMPAKFFKMEDQLGTIEAGKLADLVLLGQDPLADIGNLRLIEGVMLNGQWLDRQMLSDISKRTESKIHDAYSEKH